MIERDAQGMPRMKPTLIIMAKAPRIGAGKQRLARAIGPVEAWRVNRALNALTLRAARDPRWNTMLCVAEQSALRLRLPGIWPGDVPRISQARGELGARLAHALAPHRQVAVIGTDCPGISRAQIAAAFKALRRAPFALGPSEDGGFWIVAARSGRKAARAMREVRWSSESTAQDVMQNLRALGHAASQRNIALLPVLYDIDSGADYARWSQRPAMRVSSA
jgi:uncharacterized protein